MPSCGMVLISMLREKGWRERLRSRAGSIESGECPGGRIAIENEEVAAQTILHRLGHGENGVGCNGGVNRGTAAGQDLSAGLRGQNLAGGGNSLPRDDHGPTVIAARALERQGRDERGHDENETTDPGGGAIHFTLFIHLRMGPVTLVSAVSGDITSEIWLWSL